MRFLSQPAEAKVSLCESSSLIRKCLTEALRELGFVHITSTASPKELLELLEIEPADWVITTLEPDEPVNGIHVLKLLTELPAFRKTRTSLLIRKDEEFVLPLAYELGALSHHDRSLPAVFGEDFGRLLSCLGQTHFDPTLTAAVYLRRAMRELRAYSQLIKFERALLQLYPGSSETLFQIAETYFLSDQQSLGLAVLAQVSLLGDKSKERALEMQRRYVLEPDDSDGFDLQTTSRGAAAANTMRVNALGLECCIIVDPDTAVQYSVKQAMTQAGVTQVICFTSATDAWRWIEDGNRPDLIIQEWRLPGLPGPLLLQRIRQHGLVSVPIVVVSSLIRHEDVTLVAEMGVSAVIEKPFEISQLLGDIIWVLQQQLAPTEQLSLDQKIRKLLELGRLEEATPLERQYLDSPVFDEASKLGIAAEFAFHRGKFIEARDLAFKSLKQSRNALSVLSLLGKSLLKLGAHADAMRCFAKAQELSPKNVSRLCEMSMLALDMGQVGTADSTLARAAAIDPDHVRVVETTASIALAKGDAESARQAMARLDSLSRIMRFMNNKAVAMTRCGSFEDAIALYRSTIAALPGAWRPTHDIVTYNLSLALVRYSDLEKAVLELAKIKMSVDSPIASRAESLRKRLEHALSAHMAFVLSDPRAEIMAATAEINAPPAVTVAPSSDNTSLKRDQTSASAPEPASTVDIDLDAIESKPGDICLYRVYLAGNLLSADSLALLEEPPRFRLRSSIVRPDVIALKAWKAN